MQSMISFSQNIQKINKYDRGLGSCCIIEPSLNKAIRCHVGPYIFFKVTIPQIRHQTTHKVGCQPGDCMWSL